MKRYLLLLIFNVIFFLTLKGQEGIFDPETENIDLHTYYFKRGDHLRQDIKLDRNRKYDKSDSLALFLSDSIQFHRERSYEYSTNSHSCQNRYYKFGYVNTKNKVVIPFEFDYIQNKFDGLGMAAKKERYFGIIDGKGNTVLPFEYSDVLINDSNLIAVYKMPSDSVVMFFNKTGDHLFSTTGFNPRKLTDKYISISNKRGGFKGVIDRQGKWLVSPGKFNYVQWIKNDLICAYKSSKYGVVNFKDKVILPFEYSGINAAENKQFIVYKDGKSAVVNNKNRYIIRLDSNNIRNFGTLYIVSKYMSNTISLYDVNGKVILAGNYRAFNPGYREKVPGAKEVIAIEDIDKRLIGLYGKDGTMVLPIEYNAINYESGMQSIIICKKSDKQPSEMLYAGTNLNGVIVVPFSSNKISYLQFSPKLLLSTNSEENTAFIDAKTGAFLTQYEYPFKIYDNKLTNGYIAVRKKWFYGLISPEGKKITDEIYDYLDKVTDDDLMRFNKKVADKIICLGTRNGIVYGITNEGQEIIREKVKTN